jgi:hypothetical protein
MRDREGFLARLRREVELLEKRARKRNLKPAVRLNGSSDLPWERIVPSLFAEFPQVRFYDYTKSPSRVQAWINGESPRNYHLTFSRAETEQSQRDAERLAQCGANVAVVFDRLPYKWRGRPVIDGDKHDARFVDRRGVIVGLIAKGKAKKDRTGFVVRTA